MLIPAPSWVELAWRLIVPLILVVGVVWLVRRFGLSVPPRLDAALASAWAPVVAGTISAAILLVVWRSLDAPPQVHDEQAYVLQAQIFARGWWTGQPPPIREFFEQTHVFVEPRLAAKYPPGNSLLLVPGIWLGLPGLMPALFTAAAGGLLFAIVRRLTDPWLATLTWALWSTSTTSLFWRASYYSQNADTALWLLALWGLVQWKGGGKVSSLILAVCVFAWMYLTRPLTAVALAAPAGVVLLAIAWRRGLFGQMGVALAAAAPLLLLNPVWHQRTLGDWRINPYTEYSRQYMPFEKPGFAVDRTPPARVTLPHIWIDQRFLPYHEQHRLSALPAILPARIIALGLALGEHWRIGLVVLFAVGAIRAGGAVGFAMASILCLLLAHLVYAHPARWTLYYAEVFPAFFFVAGYGLMEFARAIFKLDGPRLGAAVGIGLVCMAPWCVLDVWRARGLSDDRNQFHYRARNVLATLPEHPAIVFVQYPPDHWHGNSLVMNTPDYRTAPIWVVYDRGTDNERLLATSDRAAYRLKTATWTLERIR